MVVVEIFVGIEEVVDLTETSTTDFDIDFTTIETNTSEMGSI